MYIVGTYKYNMHKIMSAFQRSSSGRLTGIAVYIMSNRLLKILNFSISKKKNKICPSLLSYPDNVLILR